MVALSFPFEMSLNMTMDETAGQRGFTGRKGTSVKWVYKYFKLYIILLVDTMREWVMFIIIAVPNSS